MTNIKFQKHFLTWRKSIERLEKAQLTKSAYLIAKKIIEEGRIFLHKYPHNRKLFAVIDVHHFLNHRIDTKLIDQISLDFSKILNKYSFDLILTAATSGISPAYALSRRLNNTPFIYARKEVSITFKNEAYVARSLSITGGKKSNLYISKRCITPNTGIVLFDDFLDKAILAKNLVKVVSKAQCDVIATAFIIEKSQHNGREKLIKAGILNENIHSLLRITKLDEGRMQIEGIPEWLTLKN